MLFRSGQRGRRNFLNWLRFAWGAIKGHFNISSETHIYEPIEEPGVSNKKQYILSVLKKGPFIVNVQNVQNIDTQSAELFQSISKNIPDLIWLLEYTTPEEEYDDQFYIFCNEWRCVADPSVYVIKKLDFDLAFNLAPQEMQNPQQRKRIEAQYEKAHGNLLTIMVVPKNLDNDGDYIYYQVIVFYIKHFDDAGGPDIAFGYTGIETVTPQRIYKRSIIAWHRAVFYG